MSESRIGKYHLWNCRDDSNKHYWVLHIKIESNNRYSGKIIITTEPAIPIGRYHNCDRYENDLLFDTLEEVEEYLMIREI